MSYKIERLDDFGKGITYIDNKICFVSNALVDEEVDVNVIRDKNKYLEGVVDKYYSKSKKRVKAECPYYGICGGCNTMHFSYAEELKYKKDKVERILKKYAKLDNVVKDIIKTDEFNYRNKVTLKVKNGKIGYFKDKSYDLVNIDKCIICKDSINKAINKLYKLDLNGINEVIIRTNYKDEILLYLMGNIIDNDYYLNNLKEINNIVVNNYKDIDILKGNDYLIDKIGEYEFRVSYNSFFQVNKEVKKLYDKVEEYADLTGKENVIDLYCGTGTIGIYLAKKSKKVIGFEINENAVKDANYNKKINKVNNIEFVCNDVSLLKEKYKDIDLVIVDPPRSGLDKNSINYILKINPSRIIYVSCDPVTLSRDLSDLKQSYDVREVTVVNMFPKTYHVETVSILCRKTIEK